MSNWDLPLRSLKGIGAKTEERFAAAGIHSLGDLVGCFPRRYDSFGEAKNEIDEAADGQLLAVCGFIENKLSVAYAGRYRITSGTIRTETQRIPVSWFNMPYLRSTLLPGKKYVFRGYVKERGRTKRLSQPSVYEPEAYERMAGTLQPVYSLGKGLRAGSFTKAVAQALDMLSDEPDFLPEDIVRTYRLAPEGEALRKIHFPKNEEEMLRARERLVFDEFLLFLLGIRQLREGREAVLREREMPSDEWAQQALRALPYELTGAQKRTWGQIERDMSGRQVMARLVQGDVGSGKTVIAFLALVKAVENGGQGALMVPTEVLARQHFEAFEAFVSGAQLPVRAVLLTGGLTAAKRREAHEKIASGQVQVVIGTHALFSEKVVYKNLVLAVTDEQHRFGVRQRENLGFKGANPHILVMSATPIPRTLAVILYGDMDVSVIDELPAGRRPIRNALIDAARRPDAYAFIRRETQAGHQAYVICPMVEESEEVEASNVIDYAQVLRKNLPEDVTVAYLHGRMPGEEKTRIMEQFVSGQIRVLVSTTVVEVGVNVPNATVMMVEDAQRFGLAQLHQLRGRVGRGDAQSYCILINTAGDNGSRKRLEIMKSSNDGFEIARKDLELRGPGDLFGVRQSGLIDFRIGDVFSDADILQKADEAAGRIIGEDDGLSSDSCRILREKLQHYMKQSGESINI